MSSTRRRRIQKLSALALLLSASGASLLPAAIFTVGSDGACTHATINNALLASLAAGAPSDELKRLTAMKAPAIVADLQALSLVLLTLLMVLKPF